MKSVYEQIRRLRRQMDEDFEIHSERLNAKTLAIAQLQTTVTELQTTVKKLGSSVDKLRGCSEQLLHTSQASEASFRTYRRRYEKILDVLQTGQLTQGLESSSKFQQLEERVTHLEQRLDGAA